MLVGHSRAGGPGCKVSLLSSETEAKDEPVQTGEAFSAAIRRTNAQNREARERLAAHVQQLLQIPAVRLQSSRGDLAVFGLLYQAESGVFFTYDVATDSFRPLGV